MFENIIGHEAILERLKQELAAGSLPSSLLLYGPPYSGKISTALEIARAVTCERETAEWNCSCRSCETQRVLVHPDTLLMGTRYFLTEINASADVLSRTRKPPTQYLYVRAVRKLLHRFDSVLWEGSEAKRATAQTQIEEIEDRLVDLLPDRELPSEQRLTKSLQTINEACGKAAQLVGDTIPINQIRRAVYWAHTTGQGRAKVIILESAENMLESARNALLKTLEEPPPGVYFILTTTRRGAIIPTILSRLRSYHLPGRSPESAREVLRKIFREDNPEYHDLREYFLAWNETDVTYLKRETRRFLDGVLDGDGPSLPDGALLAFLSDPRVFRPFLEELSLLCGEILSSGSASSHPVSIDRLEAFSGYIRQCAAQSEQYNQNRGLLLECLYYNMRKAG